MGNRIVSDRSERDKNKILLLEKKVLQEPLYYGCMVPRIDLLLTGTVDAIEWPRLVACKGLRPPG